MFATLKNKIKEETGSDLNKIASLLNSPLSNSSREERHSRQNSGSSVSSLGIATEESSPALLKQDSTEIKLADGKVLTVKEIKKLEKRELEWRQKLQKKDDEWLKKFDKKEEEWKKLLDEKQKEWKKNLEVLENEKLVLEEEKREVFIQKRSLEDSLKIAEEYKKKVYQYQEDIDQLEGFQTQEMAKLKHLLLAKEQEISDRLSDLKESNNQIESLKSEINRLRRFEEEHSNLQEQFQSTDLTLSMQYNEQEKMYQELETNFTQINIALEDEKTNNISLREEIVSLKGELSDERGQMEESRKQRERDRAELEATLMRNAQVNQQMELARHELRGQEREAHELHTRLTELEETLKERDKELDKKKVESQGLTDQLKVLENVQHDSTMSTNIQKELTTKISELEEQLNEKNKSIKVLQQKLTDMKKTLQKELRVSSSHLENGDDTAAAVLTPSSSKQVGPHLMTTTTTTTTTTATTKSTRTRSDEDDVNFKYLKHVLIKFLTSREYEAQHLTRAVSTLLRFSPEEERLLRETLDWKMSWFGTRPRLGVGQTSKTIPPS